MGRHRESALAARRKLIESFTGAFETNDDLHQTWHTRMMGRFGTLAVLRGKAPKGIEQSRSLIITTLVRRTTLDERQIGTIVLEIGLSANKQILLNPSEVDLFQMHLDDDSRLHDSKLTRVINATSFTMMDSNIAGNEVIRAPGLYGLYD